MIKPDDKVIQSLQALKPNVHWQCIVEWFRASLIEQSINNNMATGEATLKGQGRGLELAEIVKHIEKVGTYLENKG